MLLSRLTTTSRLRNSILFLTLTVISTQFAGNPFAPAAQNGTDSTPLILGFEEPFVKTAPTSPEEDSALLLATKAYRNQKVPDDFRIFDSLLSNYPSSGWRVALLTNLGLSYYHYGHFSKAIDAWEQAWETGKSITEPSAKALVDRALGELARMHARLGHAERLSMLLKEISDRPVTGAATEAVTGAKEGLWVMKNEPGVAYLCGPMALRNLMVWRGASGKEVEFLESYRSGPQGVTLAEVSRLAKLGKLHHHLVYRGSNQPVPVPSIVHWKVNHFAALVTESNGRFHIIDPTFGEDLWVTREALDSESSGYFLAPGERTFGGWREVKTTEAKQIWGNGLHWERRE